jgi:hypothetical protein
MPRVAPGNVLVTTWSTALVTVTVSDIEEPWTVHQNTYVPGCVKVQLPLQFLPDAAGLVPTGTSDVQLGVFGPAFHSTPWLMVRLGLTIFTAPPEDTVVVLGLHVLATVASTVGSAATAGTASTAPPSATASPSRNRLRASPRSLIARKDYTVW